MGIGTGGHMGTQETTDFSSHHIEGYAQAAIEAGREAYFKVPLISEVLPGLWQGGCKDGVALPEDFDFVVSLYPWEQYHLGPKTQRVEQREFDSADVPDVGSLVDLAYAAWQAGQKVLIHCQAGLNRSGLTTAQVLMRDGYTAADAIALLRKGRCDMVLCNAAFVSWLLTHDGGAV